MNYKTKLFLNKKEQEKIKELPKTPFFIKDNENMGTDIYMVVKSMVSNDEYSFIDISNGQFAKVVTEGADYLLERINSGRDTLLASEIHLYQ